MKPRTVDPTSDRPCPTRLPASSQNGIRHRMNNKARTTSMVGNAWSRSAPRPGSVNTENPRPGVSSRSTAVTRVRLCTIWVARHAPKVRHHQRAIPSVWGRAWNINAIGAPAIKITVNRTRTT